MYLHPGGQIVLRKKDIIGVFDIDKTTVSKRTRAYLTAKETEKKVILTDFELPQTFIITVRDGKENVYLSHLNSKTVVGRKVYR